MVSIIEKLERSKIKKPQILDLQILFSCYLFSLCIRSKNAFCRYNNSPHYYPGVSNYWTPIKVFCFLTHLQSEVLSPLPIFRLGKLHQRNELTQCHTDTSSETGKKSTALHSSQLTAGHGFFPPIPWCEQDNASGSRAAVPWGAPGHGCAAPARSWGTGSGPAAG